VTVKKRDKSENSKGAVRTDQFSETKEYYSKVKSNTCGLISQVRTLLSWNIDGKHQEVESL